MDFVLSLMARHEGHHEEEDYGGTESPKTGYTHDPDRQWANRNHLLAKFVTFGFLLIFTIRLLSSLYQSYLRRHRSNKRTTENPKPTLFKNIINSGRSAFSYIKIASSTTIKIPAAAKPYIPLSNIPIGQIGFVILYTTFIAGLLSYRVVKHDETYAERIGFRGALIAVPQVPILFILATRLQIPGIRYILGGSYKDLIWFHRWVARVFIGSVSVHAIAFFVQWAPDNFLWEELEIVPYVKYGIYAWGIMLITIITTILYVRKLSYECFVVQHTVCAFASLYLMRLHIPGHHRKSIDVTIALVALDWILWIATALYMNVTFTATRGQCNGFYLGHKMTLEAIGNDLTVVTVHNANILYQPGQSIDIWVPKFWNETPHPFTILPPSKGLHNCECPRIQLVLKTKTGFTARLHKLAEEAQNSGNDKLRCYVVNKGGRVPPIEDHEVVVLISSSTGASFSSSIAQGILTNPESKVRKLKVLLIGREKSTLEYYRDRIRNVAENSSSNLTPISIHTAITGHGYDTIDVQTDNSENAPLNATFLAEHTIEYESDEEAEIEEQTKPVAGPSKKTPQSLHLKPFVSPVTSTNPNTPFTPYTATSTVFSPGSVGFDRNDIEGKSSVDTDRSSMSLHELDNALSTAPELSQSFGRPDIALYLHKEIDGPFNTAVSVCGGSELVTNVRKVVAKINAERAINDVESCMLHTEGFTEGS